jgi:hypothetical protein
MPWKFANEEEVERFYIDAEDGETGEDWVELKAELSKRTMNELISKAPRARDGEDPSNADQLGFIQEYGRLVTIGWSAVDENGNPMGFSIKTYLELEARDAAKLDKIWSTHLAKQMGGDVDDIEGKLELSEKTTPEASE